MSNIVGSFIPYFTQEKIKERQDKKEKLKKNVDSFWQRYEELPLEDKSWVLEYLTPDSSVRLITDEQTDETDKHNTKMHELLPENLWPRTVRKQSKSRIKQEKVKVKKQQELQSTLSSKKDIAVGPVDENENITQ